MCLRICKPATVLTLCLFIAICAKGQGWKEQYDQSVKLYEQEKLEQAYEVAGQALQTYLSESGAVNDNYAAVLRHYANVCYGLAKFDQGVELLTKEIQVREAKPDQGLADAHLNLAEFYKQLEKFNEAIGQIQAAEKILQSYFKVTDPELVSCRLNLAITYYLAGALPASFEILREHFRKLNELATTDNEELHALYYYGLLLNDLGKTEEAV